MDKLKRAWWEKDEDLPAGGKAASLLDALQSGPPASAEYGAAPPPPAIYERPSPVAPIVVPVIPAAGAPSPAVAAPAAPTFGPVPTSPQQRPAPQRARSAAQWAAPRDLTAPTPHTIRMQDTEVEEPSPQTEVLAPEDQRAAAGAVAAPFAIAAPRAERTSSVPEQIPWNGTVQPRVVPARHPLDGTLELPPEAQPKKPR